MDFAGVTAEEVFARSEPTADVSDIVSEIIKEAENYIAYGFIWPLFYTAVFYLAFVGILTLLFGYCERKLDYFKA